MLHIQIIQVGKTKDSYFRQAEQEYVKRLGRYGKITIDTVDNDEKILSRINKDSYVIALVINGKEFSSEDFAEKLRQIERTGHISFLIGGPHGLSANVIDSSDFSLSFSKMTFTHQMIRIILLEQIYRAGTIIEGKKYHY
ncbi:23S rRNA (pseudouridine(1915)-N(3))-methyltransferase RlmH [bacterium]|nr:23S rRNA (pseudouridine(1915)-N(3))-methyltransferase RlmH [bacterium]